MMAPRGVRAVVLRMCLLVTVAAQLSTGGAHAAFKLDPALARELVSPGAIWYSASLNVPYPEMPIKLEQSYREPERYDSVGCFEYVRFEDSSWVGGLLLNVRDRNAGESDPEGTYLHVRLAGAELGSEGPPPKVSASADTLTCLSETRPPRAGRVELLMYVAASDPIRWSRIRMSVHPGIEVLAESWGTATHFDREWDLRSDRTAAGGTVTPPIAGARVGAAFAAGTDAWMTRRYEIGRAGYFWAGGGPLVGTTRHTITHPSGRTVSGDDRFWGDSTESGAYELNVDVRAQVGAHVGSSHPTVVGASPFIAIPTADADFPACSHGHSRRGGTVLCAPGNPRRPS